MWLNIAMNPWDTNVILLWIHGHYQCYIVMDPWGINVILLWIHGLYQWYIVMDPWDINVILLWIHRLYQCYIVMNPLLLSKLYCNGSMTFFNDILLWIQRHYDTINAIVMDPWDIVNAILPWIHETSVLLCIHGHYHWYIDMNPWGHYHCYIVINPWLLSNLYCYESMTIINAILPYIREISIHGHYQCYIVIDP